MTAAGKTSLQTEVERITSALGAVVEGQFDRRLEVETGDATTRRLVELINLVLGAGEGAARHLQHQTVALATREDELHEVNLALRAECDERRAAEGALRESERLLRNIFESVADGVIVTDGEGRLQLVNRATEAMFGYGPDDLIGQDVSLLFPHWAKVLHRAHRRSRPAEARAARVVRRREVIGVRRDGVQFPVEASIDFLRMRNVPILVGVLRDITERRRLDEALKYSMGQLRTLVANLPGAVYRCAADSAWTMQYISSGVTDLCGHPADEFLGNQKRSFASIIHEEDRQRIEETVFAHLARRAPFVLEYRILHVDGGTRWVREHGQGVFAPDGAIEHLDGVIFDITEFKRVEQELAAYHDELEARVDARSAELVAAQRQLMQAEKLASIGQLSAGIAHEINTPVQYVGDNLHTLSETFEAVLGVIEAYRAEARQLPPEAAEALRRAEEAADLEYLLEDTPKAISQSLEGVQRVAKIVRAMKDFSHVGRDDLSPIDLNALIESTLTVCRNEYKYVADVTTALGELPPVECYATHVSQVLLNLIVNAAHAIADTKQRGTIHIRTTRVGDCVEVGVSDTGTGIPEEIRSRIYDPFFTTKAVGRGTGQGLHIVYQTVVEMHGGTIELDTKVGAGTTFRVRIPVTRPIDEGAPATGAAREVPA